MKKVWTFDIRGGSNFTILMPHTPLLDHTGGMTLWKLVGTEHLADAALALIQESGAKVVRYTEEQNEEQADLRRQRLGLTE